MSQLNTVWLEEYRLINAELTKINNAQGPLKVEPAFKGDKAAMITAMNDVFSGSGIRKDNYTLIAGAYADFGEVYKDIDNAAALARSAKSGPRRTPVTVESGHPYGDCGHLVIAA